MSSTVLPADRNATAPTDSTTSNRFFTLTSSQLQLVFPVLTESGLTRSDPSLDRSSDNLGDSKSTATGFRTSGDDDATSETPLLGGTIRIDTEVQGGDTVKPSTRDKSFLADTANTPRDTKLAVRRKSFDSAVVGGANSTSHSVRQPVPRRTVDKKWLEAVARSQAVTLTPTTGEQPSWTSSADDEVDSSRLWGFSETSYMLLEEQISQAGTADIHEDAPWLNMLSREWSSPTPTLRQRNGGSVESTEQIQGGSSSSSCSLKQAKRFVILALPLLALTIWASVSPATTYWLFEASHKVPPTTNQPTPMEVHSVMTSLGTHQAPATELINVAIATSSPCRALGSPRQMDVFRLLRRNASQSTSAHEPRSTLHSTLPLVTETTIVALEAKDKEAKVKEAAIKPAGHPLAFFQSTFATTTSGFNARRRQRLTTTSDCPPSSLGIPPTAGQVSEATQILETASKPSNTHTDAVLRTPGWYTGGIAVVSSLFPYAAEPFTHLRQELMHIAGAVRSVVEVLVTKTRRIKEPMGRYLHKMTQSEPNLAGTATKEAAEVVIDRAWDELHLVLNNLESQMIRLRMHGDEALLQAQRASRRTIKQVRQGLDNVLRETADIVERHTGKEIPLPKSVQRKRTKVDPPPSTIGEKVQQLLYHVSY